MNSHRIKITERKGPGGGKCVALFLNLDEMLLRMLARGRSEDVIDLLAEPIADLGEAVERAANGEDAPEPEPAVQEGA